MCTVVLHSCATVPGKVVLVRVNCMYNVPDTLIQCNVSTALIERALWTEPRALVQCTWYLVPLSVFFSRSGDSTLARYRT